MNGKEIQFIGSSSSVPAHTHSASDITSGVLPVARGGTGVTNLSALKNQLNIETLYTKTQRFYVTDSSVYSYMTGYACKRIVVTSSTHNNITIGRSTYTSPPTNMDSVSGCVTVFKQNNMSIEMILSSNGQIIYYGSQYWYGDTTLTITMYV